MKGRWLIVGLLLLSLQMGARERTETELMSLASQALMSLSDGETLSNSIAGRSPRCAAERSNLSVWAASGVGFVVLSRDDSRRTVLAVSSGEWDEDDLPCGLEWWLNATDEALAQEGEPTLYTTDADEEGEYFLTSLWKQTSPYNSLCPVYNGSTTVTGCLPLALSQVMNYYEYPYQGTGTGSYTLNSEEYTDLAVNAVYDWDNMLDSYTSAATDTQKTAVATLLYDACIAVVTDFGTSASGSQASSAATAIKQNFGYDSLALEYYYRMFYTDTEWMTLVDDELSSGNPLIYCGVDDDDGGHAFVVDGIRADGLVHVNWGWGGNYNGWYSIDDLTPNSSVSFTSYQCMLFGFRPYEATAGEENRSSWAIQGDLTLAVQTRGPSTFLSLSLTDTYNMSHRYFDGGLYVVFCDTLGNIVATELFYDGSLSSFYGWSEASTNVSIPNLSTGQYLVYLASRNDDETDYQPIRSLGGVEYYTLTVKSRNRYTLEEGDLTAVGTPVVATSEAAFVVYDLTGRCLGTSLDGLEGIVVVKQGGTSKKILLTN